MLEYQSMSSQTNLLTIVATCRRRAPNSLAAPLPRAIETDSEIALEQILRQPSGLAEPKAIEIAMKAREQNFAA